MGVRSSPEVIGTRRSILSDRGWRDIAGWRVVVWIVVGIEL